MEGIGRRLFVLGAASSVSVGLGGAGAHAGTLSDGGKTLGAPLSLDQKKSLVLQLFHLFDEQRFDEARQLLHPDFQEPVTGVPIDTFLARRKAFYAIFPDGRHTFDEVIAEGDQVVTTGAIHGVHSAPFMGVPATGKKVSMRVWHLNRVQDGKIITYVAISDMVGLLRQIGAVPPAPHG